MQQASSGPWPTLADYISHYTINLEDKLNILPRGLANVSNTCFMNAILQTLVYFPPLVNFVASITPQQFSSSEEAPLLYAISRFIHEFKRVDSLTSRYMPDFGKPLSPKYLYDAMNRVSPSVFSRGKQEDAAEFLSYLLNTLHEELLHVIHCRTKEGAMEATSAIPDLRNNNDDNDDDWLEIGPKSKISTSKKISLERTPISELFVGTLRSVISLSSGKRSITLQPYFTLPLDIQLDDICTLEDALRHLTRDEILRDFTSSRSGEYINARKQILFDTLPPILIFQLKQFYYDDFTRSIKKLGKHVSFPCTLDIPSACLSPALKHSSMNYSLFAVVDHIGSDTTGGHYTCYVMDKSYGWLLIDDISISRTTISCVLKPRPSNMAPYLLFYKRM